MLYICMHISVAKSLQGPWKVCKCGWNFLPSVIICTYDFFRASKSEQQAGLLLMVLLITQAYGKINFSNNFIILVCRCKNWGGGGGGGWREACAPLPHHHHQVPTALCPFQTALMSRRSIAIVYPKKNQLVMKAYLLCLLYACLSAQGCGASQKSPYTMKVYVNE